MKSKLLNIINYYGVDNQQRKLEEEVYELQKAIIEYQQSKLCNEITKDNLYNLDAFKDCIAEEMADVCVLLMQFCNFYKINVPKIGKIMEQKIDRQIERIKNETDNTMVE